MRNTQSSTRYQVAGNRYRVSSITYRMGIICLLLFTVMLMPFKAEASNVSVSNAEIRNLDLDAKSASIYFKVSQDDPFPSPVNGALDYVWIFAKYWMDNNDNESTGWHSAALTQDKFIASTGADGTTSFSLSWDFSGAGDQDLVTHLNSGGTVKVKVGAIEMVKVPDDAGVNSFYISKYEVSQSQYTDYLNMLDATTAQNRWTNTTNNGYSISYSSGAAYGSRYSCTAGERAVNFIDYADATAYAAWAGLRLLTEEEFEKAANGPDEIGGQPNSRIYPWGNTDPSGTDNYLWNSLNIPKYYCMSEAASDTAEQTGQQSDQPVDVGHYQSDDIPRSSEQTGVSPFGIADLAGNVAEWTEDTPGTVYGIKGGSFASGSAGLAIQATKTTPSTFETAGLRLAK